MKDCLWIVCNGKIQSSSSAIYCKNYCRRMDLFTKWFHGEYIPDTKEFPEWLRKLVIKNGCMECDWKEINPFTGLCPVQIDHISGNSSDHSRQNIRALCPNCHSLTGTYGALNKGNGRKFRYSDVV